MTPGVGLLAAGVLIESVGLIALFASSVRWMPRMRRFWPCGSAIICAGCVASGAGDLILRHWFAGWFFLFMALVSLGIIAKVASTAPGVR